MNKKLSWPMIVCATHLLVCVLLSFTWGFLEGMYLGFWATFFVLWGLTLPALSGCLGLILSLLRYRRERRIFDAFVAVVSGLILAAYAASAIGLWKNATLGFVYIAILLLTFLLWTIALVRWLKRKN